MNRQSAKPLKGFPPPRYRLPLPSRAGCDELPTIRVHVLPCGLASRSPLQTQVFTESGEISRRALHCLLI